MPQRPLQIAYLSIGSNVDRANNISGSLAALREVFGNLALSGVVQCPSAGFVGEDFYNLAASVSTDLSASEISAELKQIETAMGRQRSAVKFSDRLIDIDLIMLGSLSGHFDGIELPRKDLYRYDFVLGPMAELAPERIDPLSGQTLSELWQQMQQQPGFSDQLKPVQWPPGEGELSTA